MKDKAGVVLSKSDINLKYCKSLIFSVPLYLANLAFFT